MNDSFDVDSRICARSKKRERDAASVMRELWTVVGEGEEIRLGEMRMWGVSMAVKKAEGAGEGEGVMIQYEQHTGLGTM
jgi:hypothetical protein